MSEDALWDAVRGALSPFGRFVRVENRCDEGTPDVAYVLRGRGQVRRAEGWLELKHEPAWPVGRATPVAVRSLTRAQVNWHTTWALAGGRIGTLLQVGRTYLALDHLTVGALFAGDLTRRDLEARAKVWGEDRLPVADLVRWLARPLDDAQGATRATPGGPRTPPGAASLRGGRPDGL